MCTFFLDREKVKRIIFGKIYADYLTMDGTINAIEALVKEKNGGFIVTPNVDHIVMAEKNELFRSAYNNAALSLADGKPLIWMSRLAGVPLPEKISGSDLIFPLLQRAAERAYRVYFLGAAPGVGDKAAKILSEEIPNLNIVGTDAPPMGFDTDLEQEKKVLEKLLAAKPDIVLFALGAPKQEILMYRWYRRGINSVMLGIGAGLDFIAGNAKRAPKWMSDMGFEWLYRLSREPRRLSKRYLIRDIGIISIFFRMMRTPKQERVISKK